MKKYLIRTLAALLLLTGLSSGLQAAGNLMVTPTRIVFEQRDRSAQITLINQSDKTSSYRISFVRQYMTEDGQFLPVEEGEPGLFSDPMIRFSPRQVSLPPGQSQVIRLALRRPADMADGEYRSHMLFQALPEPSSTNVEALTQQKPEGISIELVPIVGISIPVIVRHGDLHSAVTLSNARIVSGSESGSGAPEILQAIPLTNVIAQLGGLQQEFAIEAEQSEITNDGQKSGSRRAGNQHL